MTIELNLTSNEVTFYWGDTDIGTVQASDLSPYDRIIYVLGSMNWGTEYSIESFWDEAYYGL